MIHYYFYRSKFAKKKEKKKKMVAQQYDVEIMFTSKFFYEFNSMKFLSNHEKINSFESKQIKHSR